MSEKDNPLPTVAGKRTEPTTHTLDIKVKRKAKSAFLRKLEKEQKRLLDAKAFNERHVKGLPDSPVIAELKKRGFQTK